MKKPKNPTMWDLGLNLKSMFLERIQFSVSSQALYAPLN